MNKWRVMLAVSLMLVVINFDMTIGSRNARWFLASHTLAKEEIAYLVSHASFYAGLHQVAWVSCGLMLVAMFFALGLKRHTEK